MSNDKKQLLRNIEKYNNAEHEPMNIAPHLFTLLAVIVILSIIIAV